MLILVVADENQRMEIQNEFFVEGEGIEFSQSAAIDKLANYDVVFFMNNLPVQQVLDTIKSHAIFINEVVNTCSDLGFRSNVIRINGWPGFLRRKVWEAAGDITSEAENAVNRLGRNIVKVKDVPGLVSARIVATIINEAFKAHEEKLSSPDEINLAMKMGTNYPYGPFEWVENIGRGRVLSLLARMAKDDDQYQPFFD